MNPIKNMVVIPIINYNAKRKSNYTIIKIENKYKQPSQDDLSNKSTTCSSQKPDWRKFAHPSCSPKPSPCRV
jgi:hypothetical protein